MNITIKRQQSGSPAPQSKRIAQPSPYDKKWGEWGKVDLLHSEDNTVDVFLDTNIYLKRVPVASREWVISGQDADKDYNSGERDLPPEHARVFVMMPTGTYEDCFIAPFSGFSTIDQTKPYMDKEKEPIKERITPSRWHTTHDYESGSHKAVSPNEKTSATLDYVKDDHTLDIVLFEKIKMAVVSLKSFLFSLFDDEVKVEHTFGKVIKINAFDTEVEIKEGVVTIVCGGDRNIFVGENETKNVSNDATWTIGGNLIISVGGTIDIVSGGATTINGSTISLN
jgi:hypothetical protein